MNNKPKKIIILLFLISLLNNAFAQSRINVNVKDTLSNSIETVNIQISNSKSNKIVAFGVTDESGNYTTIIKGEGLFKVKASYIGYEPSYKEFDLSPNQTIEIIIKENRNYLKEIIVKANSSGMKQKGDTLTYSVEKFMNGTEETLKDIIKKLPGLDINSNGQITSNGKEVNKILVDGEDFFQNQHKLATENLSSQMIKNVELIKNYKEFKNIDNDTKTNTTAININIKEEFKNKITGNIQSAIGYFQKYKFHSNLFSFRKKIKTTLINGFNNTGEQEFTAFDYYSLIESNKTSDDNSSSAEIPNPDELPKFLIANNNAKSRKTEFTGFNSVYSPTQKLKLNIFSIFNISKQVENQILKQDYLFMDNPFSNIETNTILEKSIFNSTNIETTYKLNKSNIINLISIFNFIKTATNNDIANTSTTAQNYYFDKQDIKHYLVSNKLEFSKSFENKNRLSINLNQNLDENYNTKNISSNNPFLGLVYSNNIFGVNQNKKINKSAFGFNTKYSINFKKNQLSINSGSNYENSNINNSVENQNGFENHTILRTNDNFIGIEFNYFSKNILSYNIAISNHYIFKKTNHDQNYNIDFLSPKAKIKAMFSPNNILELTYEYSNKFPSIDNILQNKIIQDYRNIYQNNDLFFNQIIPFHQTNITYFYFKQQKFNFITNLNYIVNEKFITLKSQSNNSFNTNQYTVLPKEKMLSAMYYVEKYFSKSKLSVKHNFVYTISEKPVVLNSNLNLFKIKSYVVDCKLISSYKKFPINFETGFVFSKNIYDNSGIKTLLQSTEVFQTLTGKLTKNIFGSINSNTIFQKTSSNNKTIFMLNPKIRYLRSKWDFSLYGNNILHIKSIESIQSSSTNNYTEEKTNQILSGYIMFEVKYKL